MIKSESIIPLLTVCANSENTGCTRVGELSIEIIKRQKAENERLEDENYTLKNKIEIRDNLIEQLGSDIDIKYNTIYTMREKLKNSKSEAIKEFAERLKKRFYLSAGRCVVDVYHISNLVKEMTEVQK